MREPDSKSGASKANVDSKTQIKLNGYFVNQGAMNTIDFRDDFIGYGEPRKGSKSVSMHEEFSSSLLIADRPHIDTGCLLAAQVDRPVPR